MGPHDDAVKEEFARLALDALRWNWGDAYEINLADGLWSARRRDERGGPLEAGEPEDLRKAILDDYTAMPVPRDSGGEPIGLDPC